MAEFAKQVRIRTSSGTTYSAKIYSTTSEAGSPNLPVVVDGVQGYVRLVDAGDAKAIPAYRRINGVTKQLGASITATYGYALYTSGSGSFTVPAGVNKLKVQLVGGGAGGVTSSNVTYTAKGYGCLLDQDLPDGESSIDYRVSGAAGTNVYFGSLTGQGATPASWVRRAYISTTVDGKYGDIITYNWGDVGSTHTISTGYNNGTVQWNNSNNAFGASGVPLYRIDGTHVGTFGSGGGGDTDWGGCYAFGGASGYYTSTSLAVTPGQVISWSIGGLSPLYMCSRWIYEYYSSDGAGGTPGNPGAILVEWGQGVE